MIAAYHVIHFLLDTAAGARRLLLLLLWTLLHLFVYYCPCLYWRAGAEMKSGDMCNGGYSGTGGCKEDPTTWKRYPVTYRNIAEHHGLVDPKVCRFPSFTKVYGTTVHFADERKSFCRMHLVFFSEVERAQSRFSKMICCSTTCCISAIASSRTFAQTTSLGLTIMPSLKHYRKRKRCCLSEAS